jgi:hypothetical protein
MNQSLLINLLCKHIVKWCLLYWELVFSSYVSPTIANVKRFTSTTECLCLKPAAAARRHHPETSSRRLRRMTMTTIYIDSGRLNLSLPGINPSILYTHIHFIHGNLIWNKKKYFLLARKETQWYKEKSIYEIGHKWRIDYCTQHPAHMLYNIYLHHMKIPIWSIE